MNKIFKPACLLLYLLTLIIFFVFGVTIARISGAAEGQGLAGGAIVFFYGIIGSFLGFVTAIFIAYWAAHKTIININRIFGMLFIILACLATFRYLEHTKEKEQPKIETPMKTTFNFMKPIKIKNHWMYVSLVNDNYKEVGKGWIQLRTKYQ